MQYSPTSPQMIFFLLCSSSFDRHHNGLLVHSTQIFTFYYSSFFLRVYFGVFNKQQNKRKQSQVVPGEI